MLKPIAVAALALLQFSLTPSKKTVKFTNVSQRAVWVTVYGNPMNDSPIIKAFCVEGGTTKSYDNYYASSGNYTLFEMKAAKDTCANHSNIAVKKAAMLSKDVTIRDTGITW